ncbi:MAG: precorrin-3B C(17)-methyltransferase [Nitrospirae bacterium]|nr:precorrin-3B C(17)-methyltransferase [Nitrospirota bacterium]
MESTASIAVVAVTRGGAVHAQRLSEQLPHATLFLPAKWCADHRSAKARLYTCHLSDLVAELFPQVRFLIVFAALGAVVRVLAPHVRDKRSDPGVLVVDEGAHHVISVLSGHVGGANELARQVAALLGAAPVITTASDSQGVLALDLLGADHGWSLEDDRHLTDAMAALVNGERVALIQEAGERAWQQREDVPSNLHLYDSIDAYAAHAESPAATPVVLITDRKIEDRRFSENTVYFRPKTLVVGIGCERGVTLDEVEAAVRKTLDRHDLAFASIRNLATVSIKQDEAALGVFGDKCRLQIDYYRPAALRSVRNIPNPSWEVDRAIGTPGVAEPAAMLSAEASTLVVPKVKCGRVTVAVARCAGQARTARAEAVHHGALCLVGIGPGGAEHMTGRARSVIARAEMVVGYRLYLDLVKDLVAGKEIVVGELGDEWTRAACAIDWASKGRKVVLISSGDIGVFGMAGPVFEQLREQGWRRGESFSIEVVPGVTAASSCAAVLGAPLMHDFVTISLSDRLTPWPIVRERLEAAGRADFVVVLYNPRSVRRQRQLEDARNILLRHKRPDTPVGIVTRCGREGESVRIATLESFLASDIGMFTTIIVGNAQTLATNDFMVTPRGYQQSCGERVHETSEHRVSIKEG